MANNKFFNLTDEEIVKLAQGGNAQAYDFLIEKYRQYAKMKAKTYFITGGDNEDVVQEGMIGIFRAICDYREDREASFKTFAQICITRQIITAVKSANRQKHQILNESLSLSAGVENESGEVSELVEPVSEANNELNPENIMLLKEVVAFIKENGEDIFSDFEMKVWTEIQKGKGYREIAVQMEKNPKAVDNAIQRIRKKVENFLEC